MPKNDTLTDAFSARFASLEALIKSTSSDNAESMRTLCGEVSSLKSEMSSLKSEMSTLKGEFEQSVEAIVHEKLSDVTTTFDKKIDDVQKEVDAVKTNTSIRMYIKASEALHAYQTGIFIPNVRDQLGKCMNPDAFQSLSSNIKKTTNYAYATECVSALANLLCASQPDDRSQELLRSGLFLQDSFIVGTAEVKHLILKFVSAAVASVFREMLQAYNRQSEIDKSHIIRFSRTRTGLPQIDKALATANVLLYAAKTAELLRSFAVSPVLANAGTSLTLQTRIRVTGEIPYRTLSWSTQTFSQARTDLHAALGAPDNDAWKEFCRLAKELEEKSTAAQPRRQPERQKKKK